MIYRIIIILSICSARGLLHAAYIGAFQESQSQTKNQNVSVR